MDAVGTIIIGGGIAGLACARRLHDRGHPFLLLTDRLGGRMYAGGAPAENFGATYVTSDYTATAPYVHRGRPIRIRDAWFWDRDRFVTFLHPRNLWHRRAIGALYARLIVFRKHLNQLRSHSPRECQLELLHHDALLERATEEPAVDFIARHGLEEVNEVFSGPIVTSTLFAETNEINTFYFLGALMPMLVPTYVADFSGSTAALTAGMKDQAVIERVTNLSPASDGRYLVSSERRQWLADRVVLATPPHNTRAFAPALDHAASDGVRERPSHVWHVAGRRKREFLPGKLIFLPTTGEPTVIYPLLPGRCDLLFTRSADCDLSTYYDDPQVVQHVAWKTAVVLSSRRWRCLVPRRNLYMIGDYNICGLEDSFRTGLFAANHILQSATERSPQAV
jgi:glycine/D-amino acid oxidase-like deaminating enzyme